MSQQADKPTVIFVPGAFHTPAHYEPIISQLKKLSSPSLAVSLPTIGTHASTAGLAEDIQVIRSKLEEMVNQEARDVVLVAHSYGGNPVCQAVKGFEKSERTRSGQSGGIIHCIFINALLFAEGESIVSSSPEGSLPPWAEADGNILRPAAACAELFFSDLDETERQRWAKELLPQSAMPSITPIKNTCWDADVPITYLLSTKDASGPVEFYHSMIEKCRQKPDLWALEEIAAGHDPFLSRTADVVGVIERAAIPGKAL